jgi:hypothetical protein
MYRSLCTAATLAIASAVKVRHSIPEKTEPTVTNLATEFTDTTATVTFDAPIPRDGTEVVSYQVRIGATGSEEVSEYNCTASPCTVPISPPQNFS